jgi:hypothetical protein
MNATRRRGVTLLELTVGAAVMTGVIASAYFCLHAGFRTQRMLDERLDEAQKARVVLALIAKDLRQACVWNEEYSFVGMNRELGGIEADNLDFATHNWSPRAPGEGDICEVSYYVDRDPDTGRVGLWRRRDASPDPEPMSGGEREEIVSGVRGLRFEYYDGLWWYDSWGRVDPRRELPAEPAEEEDPFMTSIGNLYGLPSAVRISLAFGEADEEQATESRSVFSSSAASSSDASFSDAPFSDAPRPEAESAGSRGSDPTGRMSRSGTSSSAGAPDTGAPLIFQTVVYLNLADRRGSVSSASGDGSTTGTSGNSTRPSTTSTNG